MDERFELLIQWIKKELGLSTAKIEVASADASFRRYFRIIHEGDSYIAMDAPPEKEDIQPFVDITKRLLDTSTHVPIIKAENIHSGFLLLEDLGTQDYLSELSHQSCDALYEDAFVALINMQDADLQGLPQYNQDKYLEEMNLMPEWFLGKHLDIVLTKNEKAAIQHSFEFLLKEISQQPHEYFVHRDYHSRNLMRLEQNNPGVIDYQDAVIGPLSYDLVSLLRDCYVHWSHSSVEKWVQHFHAIAQDKGLLEDIDTETFYHHFNIMGLQRHIKVLGIFSRLAHRDSKEGYLKDLPLTLSYFLDIAKLYPSMNGLLEIFDRHDVVSKVGKVNIPA